MFLDPKIRDWVLIPILLVMILVGLLRNYAMKLLQTLPKPHIKQVRETSAMMRSKTLRFSDVLPWSAFDMRKQFLIEQFNNQAYLKNPNTDSMAPNPMSDPQAMEGTMEMMKKNMAMIVPQTLIMSWISFFFSGFILSKLPFPLTVRFKSMTQSGVLTKDMDARWVSSLSWYFLNLFGLNSVYTLLLGDGSGADGMQDMQQMQMMGAPQPMQNPAEIARAFKSEIEFYELLEYKWDLHDVEERLLQQWTTKSNKKLD
ncbi:integral membrane protein DUF106-domain-containing protein [Gorgonomyces haynaldii]|nr:integral membrane protein DUF106-domain-containing protein [Gorgonomyces haynaldii]